MCLAFGGLVAARGSVGWSSVGEPGHPGAGGTDSEVAGTWPPVAVRGQARLPPLTALLQQAAFLQWKCSQVWELACLRLASRLKGEPPQEAALAGHRLASRVIQVPGALIPK